MPHILQKWRFVPFLTFLWCSSFLTNAQVPPPAPTNCSDVTAGQITTTPAYCQGSGIISVPGLTSGFFTLEDAEGNPVNPAPDAMNRFTSLNAGDYIVKLHCEGSATTVDFPVTVPNAWRQLELSLSSSSTCPGDGVISATGMYGYGASAATYRYAYWSESVAGPGRADSEVAYSAPIAAGTPFQASGLAPGRYYVRVKDLCENFYTQSIVVTPEQQQAMMNVSVGSWVCTGGTVVRRVEGFLTDLHNDILSNDGVGNGTYSYTVELMNSCEPADVSAVVVNNKPITSRADMVFDIPATDPNQVYRVTVISACEEEIVHTECISLGNPLTAEHFVMMRCTPGVGGGMVRYTMNVFGSLGYLPFGGGATGTLIINSDNLGVTTFNNVSNSFETDLPANILPATFTFRDACGLERTTRIEDFAAPHLWAHPSYDCVAPGHANLSVYVHNISGVGEVGTTYELIHVGTNNVVATASALTYQYNNYILFEDIPLSQGDRYKVRVIPAGDCDPVDSPEWEVDVDNPLLQFEVNPTVDVACDDGSSTVLFNPIVTQGLWVRCILTQRDGDYQSEGTVLQNVPPGVYDYTVVLEGTSCADPVVLTGELTVYDTEIDPVLTRTLAVTCQPLNEGPQPTGSAYLSFTGLGPFDIYIRKSTESGFPATPTASGVEDEYIIPNLESGVTYYIQIVDRCGKSATQQVTINPLSPRITTNTVEPCVGRPYALEGVEYPTAQYVWEKWVDGDWETIGNSRVYEFANYEAEYDGKYRLTVNILDGCVVRQAELILNSNRCDESFALGSLGDYVWYDDNSNGLQDGGEEPATGVTVRLEGYVGPRDENGAATPADLANEANWTPMSTTVTDIDGKYSFTDLEDGYYRVYFEKAGYGFTEKNADGPDSDSRSKGNDSNVNPNGYSDPVRIEVSYEEGHVNRDNPTIDAGLVPTGSIGDYVWLDEDRDGIQDAGEPPVAGVTVNLYREEEGDWVLYGSTVTDGEGKYLFDKLPSGNYQVEFVKPDGKDFTQSQVEGASTTNNNDSDADRTTGRSGVITIDTGAAPGSVERDNMTVDAGLVPKDDLPVTLVNFAVRTEGTTTRLSWHTTEESNSSHFEVQQSVDSRSWQSIGQVAARGVSTAESSYSFTDHNPANGMNYYRLKMIDKDGTYEYSNVVSVRLSGVASSMSVYPNPVRHSMRLKNDSRFEITKLEVFDMNGRPVLSRIRPEAGEAVSVAGLNDGMYMVKLTLSNGSFEVKRIIISNR